MLAERAPLSATPHDRGRRRWDTVLPMPHASVNGQQLYYEDTGGDGPAVILSHGFLMDGDMFEPQVAALRDTHRVITWDERGFGRTEFDGQPFECLIGRDDLTDRLGDIPCPALVVHGTSDTAIPMERANALAAGLPGAGQVAEVAGAHAANLTNPEPVNAAIVEFLGGLTA
jgi:pimeloyl-ACP methyl ester carboxylesterase